MLQFQVYPRQQKRAGITPTPPAISSLASTELPIIPLELTRSQETRSSLCYSISFTSPSPQSKPEAEALKMKKVSNFNEMIELFAKDRASGAQAETAKERNARFQMNDNINLETVQEVDDFCAANDVIMESQYNIDDDIQVVHPTPSPPEQSSSAKKCKGRKRKVEENEDLASMIVNSIGSVANAILEGNKVLERVYPREYTCEEIYNALEPMGLESHELRRALRYLVANQADARALFSCPSHIRLGLLRDMMESDN